jgi:uncharacterized protein
MPVYRTPGVSIDEKSAFPIAVSPAPTAGASFVGLSTAGPFGTPVEVKSLSAFEATFGGRIPNTAGGAAGVEGDDLWHAARAFFESGGGLLFVVRTADAGADAHRAALAALEAVYDVEIVAAPGSTRANDANANAIAVALIDHAERMNFRFALIDSPKGASVDEIEAFRVPFASSRAALYYPWVRDADGALQPPSGFVAGIIAASDRERAVWKAPGNLPVPGATGFETAIDNALNERLNPQGINCFRQLAGRGLRLWGARTLSRDPDYKYISTRRMISFLERSISGTGSFAVFEPNGPALWGIVRATIEDFLTDLWRQGALAGTKTEEAFFVRCDRSTMTQDDIDAGRLIVEIGVAMIRPAEFLIFKMVQATADATG